MKKFIEYSKKIGKDFMLCQGPGGNTSFKQNDSIFIKKSGLQLADSNLDTFKKIKFTEINHFYSNSKINDEKFDKDLSIETPLHVFLEQKYVFHYHSIPAIICSIIYKKNYLNKLLIEKNITPINYIRPGLELALEIKKNNNASSSFFLYNHGAIVQDKDLDNLLKKIKNIEHVFSEILDYRKLINLKKKILGLELINNKIVNPDPSINYEQFKDKFFFPDHAVFFPYPIISSGNSPIKYDSKYIYFDSVLNKTELDYFKTLLIMYCYIKDQKLHNLIDSTTGIKLRNSDDEILRRERNR